MQNCDITRSKKSYTIDLTVNILNLVEPCLYTIIPVHKAMKLLLSYTKTLLTAYQIKEIPMISDFFIKYTCSTSCFSLEKP